MTKGPSEDRRREFGRLVGRKADRRIEARRRGNGVWFWLGMLGLIGWTVAVPTVIGVVVGLWLDRIAPASFSWTLTMLVLGLALGLITAWFWVSRESSDDTESVPARRVSGEDQRGEEP